VFGYVIENQRQYEKRQSLSCRSTVEGVEDIATVEQSGRSPAQPETVLYAELSRLCPVIRRKNKWVIENFSVYVAADTTKACGLGSIRSYDESYALPGARPRRRPWILFCIPGFTA
jgi:hypothetical protein